MHPFLSQKSLKEFIDSVNLPDEKKKEYTKVLSDLGEEGRILLFDTLTKHYLLDYEEKRTEKALELFREFASDLDYDKLQSELKKL